MTMTLRMTLFPFFISQIVEQCLYRIKMVSEENILFNWLKKL